MFEHLATDRYLYAIHALKRKYPCVRCVDVAHDLRVSKASVCRAIQQLKDTGMIESESDGHLFFTARGEERAELLSGRVSFFHRLLTEAGVESSQALQDAISFSWEMSDASYEAFRALQQASETV